MKVTIKGKLMCVHHDYVDPKNPKSILYIQTRKGEMVLTRPKGLDWKGEKTEEIRSGDRVIMTIEKQERKKR